MKLTYIEHECEDCGKPHRTLDGTQAVKVFQSTGLSRPHAQAMYSQMAFLFDTGKLNEDDLDHLVRVLSQAGRDMALIARTN